MRFALIRHGIVISWCCSEARVRGGRRSDGRVHRRRHYDGRSNVLLQDRKVQHRRQVGDVSRSTDRARLRRTHRAHRPTHRLLARLEHVGATV